jgi:hypothetical protein
MAPHPAALAPQVPCLRPWSLLQSCFPAASLGRCATSLGRCLACLPAAALLPCCCLASLPPACKGPRPTGWGIIPRGLHCKSTSLRRFRVCFTVPPLPSGRWGNTSRMPSALCTGACSPGHMCPPGSTNATAVLCAPGRYSGEGAGVCSECPAGRWGNTSGLMSSECSAQCPAGRYGETPAGTSPACSGPCQGMLSMGFCQPALLRVCPVP